MLMQIRCDKFAEEFRTIDFYPGLNTVLGSVNGSNALGKSTFLWVIDFVFGGEGYCAPGSDIKTEIKDHTIGFTFCFDGISHYFYRSTATPKSVARCDKDGHLIKNLSLDEFRRFLGEQYHPNIAFSEIPDRFFRIYGKENTYEKYPYLTKPRESDDKAADFLIRLFGKGSVLAALQTAEEELGVKETQWIKAKRQPKSFEKIKKNEESISSLKNRLSQLMGSENNIGLGYLGLGSQTFENVSRLQKELRSLMKRRRQLELKRDSIQNGNHDFIEMPLADDFDELAAFFPGVNIRDLMQIESFHRQLHVILENEINEELARLDPMIAACDREIDRISQRLAGSGIADDLTRRVLSQCVSISKQIDQLELENQELSREKELQAQRILAERRLEDLINDRIAATEEVVNAINAKLVALNLAVTNGKENAPVLEITRNITISFGTKGNTSEGTAFKSMVLFDLTILSLTNVPALIHDGNILHSISEEQFEEILRLYRDAGKQIFIAVNKAENDLLTDSVVLRLSEGHELYGYSWSRKHV